MLNELKVDELLDSGKVDSRYGLVLAAARRARQINEYTATLGLNESIGIPGPQVHTRSQHPISIAIEELREGELVTGFREEEEPDTVAEQAEIPETPVVANSDGDVSASAAAPDEVEEDGVPAEDGAAAGEDAAVENDTEGGENAGAGAA